MAVFAVMMATNASAVDIESYGGYTEQSADRWTGVSFTPEDTYDSLYIEQFNGGDTSFSTAKLYKVNDSGAYTQIDSRNAHEHMVYANESFESGQTYAIEFDSTYTERKVFTIPNRLSYPRTTVAGSYDGSVSDSQVSLTEKLTLFNYENTNVTTTEEVIEMYDDSDVLFDTSEDGVAFGDVVATQRNFDVLDDGSWNATNGNYSLTFKQMNVREYTALTINATVNDDENISDASPSVQIKGYDTKTEMENDNASYVSYEYLNDGINSLGTSSLNTNYNYTEIVVASESNEAYTNQSSADFTINKVSMSGKLQEPLFNVGGLTGDLHNFLGLTLTETTITGVAIVAVGFVLFLL